LCYGNQVKHINGGILTMKWLIAAVTVLMLAGCGTGVEWLPTGTSGGSTANPNGITFTQDNVTQAVANSGAFVLSNSVTVTGNVQSGWTVSILNDPAGVTTQFSIANGPFTTTPATILPNQTLVLQHKASTTIGGQAVSTIQVGQLQAAWITTTTP
jgi:hypothetical protein